MYPRCKVNNNNGVFILLWVLVKAVNRITVTDLSIKNRIRYAKEWHISLPLFRSKYTICICCRWIPKQYLRIVLPSLWVHVYKKNHSCDLVQLQFYRHTYWTSTIYFVCIFHEQRARYAECLSNRSSYPALLFRFQIKNISSRPTGKDSYCGEPLWPICSVLSLRPQVAIFESYVCWAVSSDHFTITMGF